ncbi:cache domain-containing protein [Rubritepida flocculans]|uniref:cache domain-containing protein n=1 Tax=Rubritepida flocculans TaxID=182403 RepID=UPI000427F19D|nr:cache domain-containing protein [Rubritepida flocculans]
MSGTAAAEGEGRRRRLARILFPLAAVAVILGALVAIALYSYTANRRGALALTEEMLHSLELRVAQEVQFFLGTAERSLRLARDFFVTPGDESGSREALERFGRQVLRQLPHIALFMAADLRGNYMAVRRAEAEGASTLLIRNEPGPRRLLRIFYDAEGREAGRREEEETGFDPRSRPWFRAALDDPDEAWTDIYVFFTDRVPGITVAAAVRRDAQGEVAGVLALDISLDALSAFLDGIVVGRRGRVVVVDGAGRVIAHPDLGLILRETPEGPVPRRLDELGDPVLARAYDVIRLEGDVRRTEIVEGERQVILATTLRHSAADSWRVVIAVPEEDFTGFVALNNRRVLLMSLGVVALALGLALLLVRQGLRADRAAQRLLEERASIAAQSAAFGELAGSTALFDPEAELPPELTERLCAVARAARACLWRLSPDGRALVLEDGFEAERQGHTREAMLLREEMPALFARLATGEPILAADAAKDRATAELHRIWLAPLGSTALIAAPIRHGARVLGVAWVEDAGAKPGEVLGFLQPVAQLLAVRLAGGARRLAERAAAVKEAEAEAAPAAAPAQLADSALRDALPADVAADVYPQVAVMVLRFTDPLALAGRRAASLQGALVEHLARELEAAGQAAGVPYLKLLGDEVVAAAGLTAEEAGPPAIRRMAAFALAARRCCLALFEEAEAEPAFRIGLDLGVAIGSRVGPGSGFLNLWGDAVRLAGQMAASAPEGGIQASEAVYAALAGQYLFRPRGRFHMPRRGAMSSYILAAEL